MSDLDRVGCVECNRAGVRRPHVAPLGQTLHGKELEDYWKAREEFWRVVQGLKQPGVEKAIRRLVGE